MSERFTRLFALPAALYAEGSPLLLEAGALLRDNENGRLIAQLKLKNLGEKAVQAAKIRLWPQDPAGRPLGEPLVYNYLDQSAGRGDSFGAKNPIPVAEPAARSFRAELEEVIFADGSLWTAPEGAVWAPLPAGEPLEKALGDRELAKQYRLRFGEQAVKGPARHRDLWRCACGALNRAEEESCHACRRSRDEQLDCDLSALAAARDARLALEKAAAEKAAAEAAEQARLEAERAAALAKEKAERAAEAKVKRKKVGKIVGLAAAALALCFAAFLLITKVVIPNSQYNKAVALLDAGQYEEAIEAFKALGNYKDAADRVPEAQAAQIEAENAAAYADAEALLAEGRYEEAIAAFEALGGYENAGDRVFDIQLEAGKAAIETGNLELAESYINMMGISYKSTYPKGELLLYLARAYAQAGDFDTAAKHLNLSGYDKRNAELAELERECNYLIGKGFLESGRYVQAITYFSRLSPAYQDSAHLLQLAHVGRMEDLQGWSEWELLVEESGAVNRSLLTGEELARYQGILYESAEYCEREGNYPRAFTLYELSEKDDFEARMAACNQKYIRLEWREVDNPRQYITRNDPYSSYLIDSIEYRYRNGVISFRVSYSVTSNGEWSFWTDNHRVTKKELRTNASPFSFDVSYASLAESDSFRIILEYGTTNSYYHNSFMMDSKAFLDLCVKQDLYGDPIP